MKIGYGFTTALCVCIVWGGGGRALAQDPGAAWPARSVRLIVPSSPGGGSDIYARLLAHGLGEALKQQFIVDNRPGASGIIGAEIASKAEPDG